ncbi:MAG TPA: YcgL domain-containing protein [Oleiagrimonas sp.]|nr:YcgL domain-containing protein [Oleiagrimonas sp.]
MPCFVYACRRKPGAYIWLRRQDDFDALPPPLREKLGELRFVLEVDLTADRKLPQENAAAILASLGDQGWYLQLPPADTPDPASI